MGEKSKNTDFYPTDFYRIARKLCQNMLLVKQHDAVTNLRKNRC